MKIVLSGGSGLIGRALSRELAAAGHRPVILSRRPESVRLLAAGVEVALWDGRSVGDLAASLEGADAVVNLAGENIASGRWTDRRKAGIRDSRVRTTEAICAALERMDRQPGVLLQASAVGVYGPSDDRELPESASVGSDFLASVCRDWEAASETVKKLGVRRVVARTGVVLSADGGALPRILMPFRLFAGGRVGSGGQWFPWIHMRDEVRALRFLLDRDSMSGAFNLCAPNPVTNRELARRIGKVLRRPAVLPTPSIALRLLLGEMATLVLDGQRAVPSRLLEAGFEFEFAELEAALRDLLRA